MAPVFFPKGGSFPNGFLQPWWDPQVPIRGHGLKLARVLHHETPQVGFCWGKILQMNRSAISYHRGVSQNGGYRTQMVIFWGEDDLDMEAPYQTNPYGHSPQTSWILRLGS